MKSIEVKQICYKVVEVDYPFGGGSRLHTIKYTAILYEVVHLKFI